jgi:hypothetical protein
MSDKWDLRDEGKLNIADITKAFNKLKDEDSLHLIPSIVVDINQWNFVITQVHSIESERTRHAELEKAAEGLVRAAEDAVCTLREVEHTKEWNGSVFDTKLICEQALAQYEKAKEVQA